VEKHHDQEVISMERFGGILLGLFGPLSLQQPLQLFERVCCPFVSWLPSTILLDCCVVVLLTWEACILINFRWRPFFPARGSMATWTRTLRSICYRRSPLAPSWCVSAPIPNTRVSSFPW
jgi:hypothetical protein